MDSEVFTQPRIGWRILLLTLLTILVPKVTARLEWTNIQTSTSRGNFICLFYKIGTVTCMYLKGDAKKVHKIKEAMKFRKINASRNPEPICITLKKIPTDSDILQK